MALKLLDSVHPEAHLTAGLRLHEPQIFLVVSVSVEFLFLTVGMFHKLCNHSATLSAVSFCRCCENEITVFTYVSLNARLFVQDGFWDVQLLSQGICTFKTLVSTAKVPQNALNNILIPQSPSSSSDVLRHLPLPSSMSWLYKDHLQKSMWGHAFSPLMTFALSFLPQPHVAPAVSGRSSNSSHSLYKGCLHFHGNRCRK